MWDLRVRISFKFDGFFPLIALSPVLTITWVNKPIGHHWWSTCKQKPTHRHMLIHTIDNSLPPNKINLFWSSLRLQTDTNDLSMMNLVYSLTSELYWQTRWLSVIYDVPQWRVRNGSIWSDSRQDFVPTVSKARRNPTLFTNKVADRSVIFCQCHRCHTPLPISLRDAYLAATLQISHDLFIDGHGSQPADSTRSLCDWMTPAQ